MPRKQKNISGIPRFLYSRRDILSMKIHSFFIFAAASVVTAGLTSCGGLFSAAETVSFTLPSWPPDSDAEYPPLAWWEAEYSAGGKPEIFRISADRSGKTAEVEVPKGRTCALLVQPVTDHSGITSSFFYPAGAVYPCTPELSWRNGFTASVFLSLCTAENAAGTDEAQTSSYLSRFNWNRLSSSLPGNPWLLDRTAVCRAIASHDFSSSLLSVSHCLKLPAAQFGYTAGAMMPQYIPSYESQRRTEELDVRSGSPSCYLVTMQKIAVITAADGDNATLEISAVPLYTGRQ
jgi:hypothetical protein